MPYRTRCFPLSQYNSLHWLFPGSSRFCTHTGSSFISRSSSSVSGSFSGVRVGAFLTTFKQLSMAGVSYPSGRVFNHFIKILSTYSASIALAIFHRLLHPFFTACYKFFFQVTPFSGFPKIKNAIHDPIHG